MTQAVAEKLTAFREYVKKMLHYQEALNLMYWDLRTGAPKKSVELRSEAIGTLSAEVFRMSTSPELEAFLNELSEPGTAEQLDPVMRGTVRELRKEFERSKKIPPDRYRAFVVLTSQAESVWAEAREQNDFEKFQPYLEQIVAMSQEFADYWGAKGNRYDILLDLYEPGITSAQLDQIFGDLRSETVKLLQAIVGTGRRPNLTPLQRKFDPSIQRSVSLELLRVIGYDFDAGRLDETVHPFQVSVNPLDNRVTTKFLEDDVRSAIFSTIHEGGHALYEQGIDKSLIGTPLATGTSMGIHESQSRFYENFIGRSRAFWEANYARLQKAFPAQLSDVSLDDFYFAVNHVEPSLIRIEADELTYNLHIMIRYEIEKGLIDGELKVADLPSIWRAKMQDYLGVVPETDADGVLQDVHWSGGSFGYFPSYALGNIYAAQFAASLAKAIPDYLDQVRAGEMSAIKAWLNENIHRHGKLLEPSEIVQQVTGEPLNARYLVEYLNGKFRPLYQL
ncbi:MAG: carboxypeptidase M32 [Alicyclobacillus sp.]|nr:carboxypeptidase M32 [Alicyclobacillus sp.]